MASGLFGSGPQSNILNTVAGSYENILSAEKQKGASMREAMGAFGKAIDPKTIGMNKFKKQFADADWTNPETYFQASQFLTEYDPAAAMSMSQRGIDLAKTLAPKAPKRVMETIYEDGENVIYSVDPNNPMDKIKVGLAEVKGPDTVVNLGSNEAVKAQAKANVAALEELGDSSAFRAGNIATTEEFLAGFKDGTLHSGAGRKALSYLPTTFTVQGQKDEQLDAMSEQAARAKLKALGEIRPTDADVKGVKESLFGIGRSEETNVILLTQYLKELKHREAKYQGLLKARAGNTLEGYVLDERNEIVPTTETSPEAIANMFVGLEVTGDLFARLYNGLTDEQKVIYANTLQ